MKNKICLVLLPVVILMGTAFSQSSAFQAGTQIPLMYSIGYEYHSKGNFAINAQAGLLTKPYDKAILSILTLFGSDEALVNTIGEAFNIGFIVQPTIKYYLNNAWFVGITGSYYRLTAKETPKDAIENYYGIALPPFVLSTPLQIRSNLSNVGVNFGRRFNFRNTNVKLAIELSCSKTIYSKSKILSDSPALVRLSDLIDNELDECYMSYGYLPSVNIFIVLPVFIK